MQGRCPSGATGSAPLPSLTPFLYILQHPIFTQHSNLSSDLLPIGPQLSEILRVQVRHVDGRGALDHLGEQLLAALHGQGKRPAGLGRRGGVGHLDRDDTAEGAGAGGVLAPDEAHVVLAGHGTGAGLVGRDGRIQREVGGGTILVRC